MTAAEARLRGFSRWLLGVDRAWAMLANLCQFAIMLIVVIDVLCRYVLNSPVVWAYDVISRYLMVAVFFFALSWTHAHDEHVRVLFFRQKAPARACMAMDLIGTVAALIVFVLIFHLGLDRFWKDWSSGAVSVGAYLWPNWIASICVPLGSGLMIVRLAMMTVAYSVGLVSGRDVLGASDSERTE